MTHMRFLVPSCGVPDANIGGVRLNCAQVACLSSPIRIDSKSSRIHIGITSLPITQSISKQTCFRTRSATNKNKMERQQG